jgi:hypothetical protein
MPGFFIGVFSNLNGNPKQRCYQCTMKLCYCFCFFFFSLFATAQKLVKGLVLDEAGQPLANATIFINNSSIATTTDARGDFVLKVPTGKSAVIVAADGFKSYSHIVNARAVPELLTVKLQKRVSQKIKYERHSALDWVSFFSENFIGSSANARYCKITNTKALHSYLSENENELYVFTDKPLTIENKALGYTIKYYLENFVFNFGTGIFSYKGYCFYQPMEGSADKQKEWEKNRIEAYEGSLMHFMRSLYRNQVAEEGFEMRPLKRIKNVSSYDAIQIDTTLRTTAAAKALNLFIEEDDYTDQVMHENNYRDVIGGIIPGDSVAYKIGETTAGVDFSNFLTITYRKKQPPKEYVEQMNGTSMTSELVLINRRPIEIEWNGSYYDTTDLLVLGYWTWAQKLGNTLPNDYIPPKSH